MYPDSDVFVCVCVCVLLHQHSYGVLCALHIPLVGHLYFVGYFIRSPQSKVVQITVYMVFYALWGFRSGIPQITLCERVLILAHDFNGNIVSIPLRRARMLYIAPSVDKPIRSSLPSYPMGNVGGYT